MRQFSWLLLSLLLLVSTVRLVHAADAPPILTVVDENSYAITPFVSLLEDPDSAWTIDDVVSDAFADRFKPASQSYLNFGYSDSTFWIRLQLRYSPTRKRHPQVHEWFYEVGKAQLNVAELYVQSADGEIRRAQSDIRIPYTERPIRLVNSVFPVTTPRDETITLYLKVKNATAFYVPLTLWTPAEFVRKTSREEILYGIFYGGMLIIILYNLFLFISIRDLSYIYYSGYLVSALIFEAIDMGHGAAWLQEGRTWFNKEYVPFAIWCTWLSSVLFTQHFLEIPKRHPLLNSFINPLFLFSLICAAFCFFLPFKLSLIFSVHFCGYAVATGPVIGAYAWYKGNKNASFFTLAWLFNVTGFITYSTVATGRAPATPLFVASMPLGTLLEAVMLSFALAERIKRAQKEALHANNLSMQHLAGYRSLLDNALEGIYQLSLQGRLINANPAMAKILGFPSVRALMQSGRKTIAAFFDEPARQWRELVRGKPLRMEIVRDKQMGASFVAIHSAQLIYDARGQPAYIEGTMVDITERHQRERAERERLREKHEKAIAESATEAKSQFLKNMSFEIRTSLAPIIGFSESLREPDLPKESKRGAVSSIVTNAQNLLQLVNDILDYSKLEAGKMAIEHIEIDLRALAAAIKSQFMPMAEQKGLKFMVEYQWPLPARITSDPTRLKQILHNLCSNAIKYTYSGLVKLRIYWNEERQQLCFAVSDTGPGMSAGVLRILSSDSQGDTNLDPLERGGLGIGIARALTHLLGGNLDIDSIQQQGSTFTASIACKTPHREQWVSAEENGRQAAATGIETPTLHGNILVAEDNPVNQKLISRIIGKTGASVTLVADGAQAIKEALRNHYDVVLMDVNMPVMGGLEATAALRAQGYQQPIYALTAEHGLEEIHASLAAGCNGHLTKPIEIPEFYRVLSECLNSNGDSA